MKNLVLADDESNIRNGIETLYPWEQLGIQIVYSASNGQKAWEYIQQHSVHILLADIRMPVMNGLELAMHVNQQFPQIRILMLSAYADFEYARKAMRYGACDYITKPVPYEKFLETMSKLCSDIDLQASEKVYEGYYPEILKKVKQYIEEYPGMATLIGAAERTGLSPNYLSQIFRQYEHLTFSEYLMNHRMNRAAILLQQKLSLSDTAWQCGYNNTRTFIQAFRKHFGITPYGYLKNTKTEE